ncbi:VOC family protein [Geminicoccus roseus]|uniref:VOC family protein n=1 Tax=Geminicoccus roseus TaxID=404900 RepID=UPI0003F81C46|nr:VOC family protein [Geminicoccus roseus]
MQLTPYLFFNGRCEEAAKFYQQVLGAEVTMMMRFKESPEAGQPGSIPEGSEDKIMHMAMRIGENTLMASDGCCAGQTSFQGMSLSLEMADEALAERSFAALAEDGQVQMPMSSTFFARRFGIVADRFGVSWMIHVPAPAPA